MTITFGRTWLAAATLLLALVAACTDSDDNERASTTTTGRSSTTTTESVGSSTATSTVAGATTTVARPNPTGGTTPPGGTAPPRQVPTTLPVAGDPEVVTVTFPAGSTTLEVGLGAHPDHGKPVIYVFYKWEGDIDPGAEAVLSLFQNGTLVGRRRFGPTPERIVRAYFEVSSTENGGPAAGSGELFLGGTPVQGTSVRSADEPWSVRVLPGQVAG